jgi:GH25 family lysozyme M1 (1,4-beta-N-acetylmuramidase)
MLKPIFVFALALICSVVSGQTTHCENCVKGIDVSHYQGEVDWYKVQEDSITFAIAKATQGTQLVDKQFANNWEGMKVLDHRSAYHFYVTTRGGKEQAKFFMKTVGDKRWFKVIPPVVDIERIDGDVKTEDWISELKIFMAFIEKKWRIRPLIYSSENFYRTYLQDHFSKHQLWIARYNDVGPNMNYWTFWQYTDKGKVNGVKGPVDMNYLSPRYKWESVVGSSRNIHPPKSAISRKNQIQLDLLKSTYEIEEILVHRGFLSTILTVEIYNGKGLKQDSAALKTQLKKIALQLYPFAKPSKKDWHIEIQAITRKGGKTKREMVLEVDIPTKK